MRIKCVLVLNKPPMYYTPYMQYDKLATETALKKTTEALSNKGYHVTVVKKKKDALETIKKLIPEKVSVMNGASVTLEQIGFIDYLKSGKHSWNNFHEAIVKEKDPAKQMKLRKEAILSDYYLGSVHALIENGEFIITSNTGSQLPHVVFTSPNLIFVVSTKKIVPTFDEALKRLETYIIPLENEHMMEIYGVGTQLNKIVIFKNESTMIKRNVNIILVEEDLGF